MKSYICSKCNRMLFPMYNLDDQPYYIFNTNYKEQIICRDCFNYMNNVTQQEPIIEEDICQN